MLLQNRGFAVYVVEVERRNWFQVGKSLATRAYWSGNSTVDPGYRWYLHKVQAAVEKACQENICSQVDLIGHSAGGWLARAFVGDALYINRSTAAASTKPSTMAPGLGAGPLPVRAHEGVRRLVTLGTPHLGPSTGGRDMTGGTLTWLNKTWPGTELVRSMSAELDSKHTSKLLITHLAQGFKSACHGVLLL